MKKYVDLSPLYIDMGKNINEELTKIKEWYRWLVFFTVMLVLSILPMFYFSFEDLLIMYLVTVWSLFGVFVSLSFIKMYKGFIKNWEVFEVDTNNDWGEMEDKHNEDWNKHFEKARNSGNYTEEFLKNEEQGIINGSKKNIEKILDDRE